MEYLALVMMRVDLLDLILKEVQKSVSVMLSAHQEDLLESLVLVGLEKDLPSQMVYLLEEVTEVYLFLLVV